MGFSKLWLMVHAMHICEHIYNFREKNSDADLGDADYNNNKVNVIPIAW